MSGTKTPVDGDPMVALEAPDNGKFTRRTFLKGAALTAGAAAAVGALGSEQLLGALEPAEGAPAATASRCRSWLPSTVVTASPSART